MRYGIFTLVAVSGLLCGPAAAAITETWVLLYSGCNCPVSIEDMDTKAQCETYRRDLEPDPKAREDLRCAKRSVRREHA